MTEQQAWPIDNIEQRTSGLYNVNLRGYGVAIMDAEQLAAAGITPPPDPIDFDALPVGAVLKHKKVRAVVVKLPEGWINLAGGYEDTPTQPYDWTVVHVPAPPSKRDALHALGLTDDDINYLAEREPGVGPYGKTLSVRFRDAAREAQAQR